MAVEVITGAPFSGKGQFVRAEIERREAAGELGLIAVDFTALYSGIVWGVQSSWRDGAVSDTGAPRMVGAMYEAALSALAVRELSGFVTTNSPRRALAIAARLKTTAILDIPTAEEQIALRAEKHLRTMGRYVPRARKGPGGRERCVQAGMVYLRERPALAGKAREVTKTGSKWKVAGKVRAFDRALWERGLTPKGREAVAEMISLGNPEPMPADVLQFILRNRVEG